MLHRRAQRVLDRAAVEAGDRLELVERDDDLAAADLGEAGGEREDLLRQARDVALGAHAGKRDGHGAERRRIGRVSDLGAGRPDRVLQPRAGALPSGLGGDERAGVALEKRHVRAEAADGHLHGQRAAARHGRERAADQRRLAVPARRDEEDLLAGGEVGDQPVELGDPVDERRGRHDLAVDERVAGYGEHGNDYDTV